MVDLYRDNLIPNHKDMPHGQKKLFNSNHVPKESERPVSAAITQAQILKNEKDR
jgi:hypothetical protein